MSGWREAEWVRPASAFAAVMLVLAMVPAVQAVVDGLHGSAANPREAATNWEGGEGAGEAAISVREVLFGAGGEDSPAQELPEWLSQAAPSSRAAQEVVLDGELGLAGFVLEGRSEAVAAQLVTEFQADGWLQVSGGGPLQAVFRRDAFRDAAPSWASVACVQVGEEVSIVVCYR